MTSNPRRPESERPAVTVTPSDVSHHRPTDSSERRRRKINAAVPIRAYRRDDGRLIIRQCASRVVLSDTEAQELIAALREMLV